MKRIALALFATAALAAASAHADTRFRIGINVGSPAYCPEPPPAVVYAPAPAVVCPPAPIVVAPARGYWKDVQVRTWVPERWVVRSDRWGRPERYCEPGYYAYRTQRVWVDGRGERGNGYAYDNRGYGYDNRGYDYGRDHRGYWGR